MAQHTYYTCDQCKLKTDCIPLLMPYQHHRRTCAEDDDTLDYIKVDLCIKCLKGRVVDIYNPHYIREGLDFERILKENKEWLDKRGLLTK